jgi:hypothetical protein
MGPVIVNCTEHTERKHFVGVSKKKKRVAHTVAVLVS